MSQLLDPFHQLLMNKGCKDTMLNISDMLGILPLLSRLVFTVRSSDGHGLVARHGVKNPNIKKCVLACVPKPSGTDIKASIWVSVG